eukprot:1787862-Rhodomonas_salina.1
MGHCQMGLCQMGLCQMGLCRTRMGPPVAAYEPAMHPWYRHCPYTFAPERRGVEAGGGYARGGACYLLQRLGLWSWNPGAFLSRATCKQKSGTHALYDACRLTLCCTDTAHAAMRYAAPAYHTQPRTAHSQTSQQPFSAQTKEGFQVLLSCLILQPMLTSDMMTRIQLRGPPAPRRRARSLHHDQPLLHRVSPATAYALATACPLSPYALATACPLSTYSTPCPLPCYACPLSFY